MIYEIFHDIGHNLFFFLHGYDEKSLYLYMIMTILFLRIKKILKRFFLKNKTN